MKAFLCFPSFIPLSGASELWEAGHYQGVLWALLSNELAALSISGQFGLFSEVGGQTPGSGSLSSEGICCEVQAKAVRQLTLMLAKQAGT